MEEVPEWRKREIAADVVNSSAATDGVCTWQCESCSEQWQEPEEKDYDRTQDKSGWPVLCEPCWAKVRPPI